ncbi:hypothetical protein A2U01_0001837 [Trifolium medium]|uniref:Uncharacterized protein n=1 Tax=Trifolium medium TaxID=97028 RepID=A0A392M242_9FABA|nr:hypothetical protein [Trifolium medium]
MMEPHAVVEETHDVEKSQEDSIITSTIDLNAQGHHEVDNVDSSDAINDTASPVAMTYQIDLHMMEAVMIQRKVKVLRFLRHKCYLLLV